MDQMDKMQDFDESPKLSASDRQKIDQNIEFESYRLIHSMVKLGAIANIIGAFLYVFVIYNPASSMLAIIWYSILVVTNLINLLWAKRCDLKAKKHYEVVKCRHGFLINVILICLIWSSTGILFMSEGVQQQITTIIFLSAVLICFSFSTAIDLRIAIASILCLLLPPIAYHLYLSAYVVQVLEESIHLHLSISSAFIVLGIFMLVAAYISNKVIKKVIRLGYENDILRQKLENMNSILEERVKQRTKELETSLELVTYQANHDLLTDLPNERLLNEQMTELIENAVQQKTDFAIACFSINNLEKIRSSIGPNAANTILQRTAQRLKDILKQDSKYSIALSRQDTFIILIKSVDKRIQIDNYLKIIFDVFKDPVFIEKQSINLTVSVGVSKFPEHGREINTLITNAEAARARASQRGGNNVRVYDKVINADTAKILNLESLLYDVIEKNELILHYQPFININTGQVLGAEALVRWQSPELGLVNPLDFIPIAEANGMILPIGEWVLRTACKQLKKWHQQGFDSLIISVNLSAKQLEQKDLIDKISSILTEVNLNPKYLELELTESNAFQSDVIPIIHQLSEMGIALSIDDFGTGYSEFSSLKLFKVDKIKIDQTFVDDIDVSIDSRNIVCNTISLASSMNIKCIAEGVETLDQVKFLKQNGCYLMQGFYFSKPVNAKQFYRFLEGYAETY